MEDTAEIIDALRKRLHVSEAQIDSANNAWKRDKAAFLNGVSAELHGTPAGIDQAYAIKKDFKSLSRLRYETEALFDHHQNGSNRTILYAIDPQILNSYSEYENPGSYRGFELIEGEWEQDGSQHDRSLYLLYLYTAIAKSGSICVLDPGRRQLLDHFAHFRRQMDKTEQEDSGYFEERLERYEGLVSSIQNMEPARLQSSAPSDELGIKFKKLIGATSAGGIYADLALTRLNDILRIGNFANLCITIQNSSISSSDKSRFFEVQKLLEEEGTTLNAARASYDRAFSKFLVTSALKSNIRDREASRIALKERNQEFLNRTAIFDVHVVNCIFEYLDIEAELKYISNSQLMYAFLENLEAHVRCPLVHSRTYFAYARPEYYAQIEEITSKVLAHSSAAASVVAKDGAISPAELETYRSFTRTLYVLRNANAFGGVDGASMQSFLRSLELAVERLRKNPKVKGNALFASRIEEISSGLTDARTYLQEGAENDRRTVPNLLSKAFKDDPDPDELYTIFNKLANQGRDSKQPLIAVRLVRDVETGLIRRLICLPIRGSYRYVFSTSIGDLVENSSQIEAEISDDFAVYNLNSFIEIIDQAISKVTDKKSKNKVAALKYYVRGVHAASFVIGILLIS